MAVFAGLGAAFSSAAEQSLRRFSVDSFRVVESGPVNYYMGVGLMSDGDQTHSESSADYADFVLER